MSKEEMASWVERLNAEPDGKKRNEIVAELCKENSLKIGDAWKLIKEAGFDPKSRTQNTEGAESNTGPDSAANAQADTETKPETEPAVIRHKTQYPQYRCAGLVLTQKTETYQVTPEQLEKLRRDPWVVIGGDKKDGSGK